MIDNSKISKKIFLTAYYDLKSAPITFDFVFFIAGANACAKALGLSGLNLTIVADGWRNLTPREKSYDIETREWRLWNLLMQIAQIVPDIVNISIYKSQLPNVDVYSYPIAFHPLAKNRIPYALKDVIRYLELGIDVRCFRASKMALKSAQSILRNDNPFVTLTPRIAKFDQARNSNLDEWYDFYQYLKYRDINAIVVPDQDDMLSSREILKYDWHVEQLLSTSLDLKLAFYELAKLNIVGSGGNIGPLLFSHANYTIVNSVIENSYIANTNYWNSLGIEPGSGKYPWMSESQNFSWTQDSSADLIRVYESFISKQG